MCDYSLQMVQSRPAKVGDKLTTTNFGHGTRGFCGSEDINVAVCVLPGTELAFAEPVKTYGMAADQNKHLTAIFRQINKEQTHTHHDVVEFPDGTHAMLTYLCEGQVATVLQLPAAPQTKEEIEEQTRAPVVA